MLDGVTLQRRLPLAGSMHKMSPAVYLGSVAVAVVTKSTTCYTVKQESVPTKFWLIQPRALYITGNPH